MPKGWVPILLFVSLLVSLCILPGCLSPYTGEIDQATYFIESANNRMVILDTHDFLTIYVGEIRANMSAAKSDLTEAKKILEKIPYTELNSQDQEDYKILMPLIEIDIELVDIIGGPFADFIEDGQTIANSEDPTIVSNAGVRFKQDLVIVSSRFSQLKPKIDALDESKISPEMKGDVIYLKSMISSVTTDLKELNSEIADTCIKKCGTGQVLGTDCQCHPACGDAYCSNDAVCCKGTCYISPIPGLKINLNTCYFE
jgi:hypothetical protein